MPEDMWIRGVKLANPADNGSLIHKFLQFNINNIPEMRLNFNFSS